MSENLTMTLEEWNAEGTRRFGPDQMKWRFICPSCDHIASVEDWKKAGASEGAVAYSCIGRALGSTKTVGEKPGPCNYAGGGLFQLNPITVDGSKLFAFASDADTRATDGGNHDRPN